MNPILLIVIVSTIIVLPVIAHASTHDRMIEFSNIGQYVAFENRMKSNLNMPIIPTNYETGLPEPTKQPTTDYTTPIFHPNGSDVRVVAFIDRFADIRNEVVIDKTVATQRGWDFTVVPNGQ